MAPLVPITLDGHRPGIRLDPPRCGEHSRQVLADAGFTEAEVAQWIADGVVR
jgi:crotonobetainyl-CoA:carnitine CoA-transferase CaiB-like acyl-CoA transferase